MVLLRIAVVVVISESDVARSIPILREPISPAVRDLEMHGAVRELCSLSRSDSFGFISAFILQI